MVCNPVNYQTRCTFCKAQSLSEMMSCVLYKPARGPLGRPPTVDDDRCIFADEFFGLCDGMCYCKHPYIESECPQEIAPASPPRDDLGNRYVNGTVMTKGEWEQYKKDHQPDLEAKAPEEKPKQTHFLMNIPSLEEQVEQVDVNPTARRARQKLAQYGITEDHPGVKYVASSGTWILRLRKHGWPKAPDVDYYSTKDKWRDTTTRAMYYGTPEDLIMFLKIRGRRSNAKRKR